jgi:DNA-binding transcriptional ArsR family regulator
MMRVDEAKALADEVRIAILDMLSKKPMSVHEIVEELRKRGIHKNVNTIRYHLQILKDAKLVELVAVKEVKGGVLKYYAARKRVYPVEVPRDIEESLKPIAHKIYSYLKSIVLEVLRNQKDLILETARRLKPCPYCVTSHFAEYIVLEAIRLAAGQVVVDPEVRSELEKLELGQEDTMHSDHGGH